MTIIISALAGAVYLILKYGDVLDAVSTPIAKTLTRAAGAVVIVAAMFAPSTIVAAVDRHAREAARELLEHFPGRPTATTTTAPTGP